MKNDMSRDRIKNNIYNFLSFKVEHLPKDSVEFKKIVFKFCQVKYKGTDKEITQIDQLTKSHITAFNDWKRKKQFTVMDLDILFDSETLNASLEDILGARKNIGLTDSDQNYIHYLSRDAIIKLGNYFQRIAEMDKSNFTTKKNSLRNHLLKGITLPVMYHLTTQSILIVNFWIENHEKDISDRNSPKVHRCFYEYSLNDITFDETVLPSEIPARNIKKEIHANAVAYYSPFFGQDDFKNYCANKTRNNSVSELGNLIKENLISTAEYSSEEIADIVDMEPLFTMYRNIRKVTLKEITANVKTKKSISSQIVAAAKKKYQ